MKTVSRRSFLSETEASAGANRPPRLKMKQVARYNRILPASTAAPAVQHRFSWTNLRPIEFGEIS
jgi:hypothetical protein